VEAGEGARVARDAAAGEAGVIEEEGHPPLGMPALRGRDTRAEPCAAGLSADGHRPRQLPRGLLRSA
jgi:hypothetical protein